MLSIQPLHYAQKRLLLKMSFSFDHQTGGNANASIVVASSIRSLTSYNIIILVGLNSTLNNRQRTNFTQNRSMFPLLLRIVLEDNLLKNYNHQL